MMISEARSRKSVIRLAIVLAFSLYPLSSTEAFFNVLLMKKPSAGGGANPCGASPSPGDTCTGGTIYAGSYNGYGYMVPPGNCTNSATPTCDGSADTLKKQWATSTSSTIGASNSTDGSVNTPIIVAAAPSDDSSAKYCQNLVYGGYSDWYLPAYYEMNNVLIPNKTAIGGFAGGIYDSSTELAANTQYGYSFAGASWNGVLKTFLAYFKCVRKF